MKAKVYIVIPAFNEEKSIGGVIQDLKKGGYQNIVVVDDSSYDKTYKTAKQAGVHVLRHPLNRGQGASLKTGIDYALLQGADVIVTFDADGQHLVKDIKPLIEPILEDEVDVTLGSRFLTKTSNVPFIKKVVLKIGVIFTFLFSGIPLTDTHNGFRALARSAAEKISIKHDRMEHASEIIDEIHKKKIVYKEVPVTIIYTEYSKQKGQSAFNSFKIAFKLIMRKLMS